jgi:hypothetical protein
MTISDSQNFNNLRTVSKMRYDRELLQLSRDEIKMSLDTIEKGYLYNKTILNLRMLELKIEIMDVDIDYFLTTYLTPPGSIC